MRKTQHDWLQAGLRILATSGAPGLTIDSLTSALGVTKGSFYHHFKGFGEYKTALLEFCTATSTLELIEQTERQTSPAAKMRFLSRAGSGRIAGAGDRPAGLGAAGR
jgi:AcrR family transcriptional regulator